MFDSTDRVLNWRSPCAGLTAGAGHVGTDLTGVYRTDDSHQILEDLIDVVFSTQLSELSWQVRVGTQGLCVAVGL